jgi:predicted extracellular nuclease
VQQATEVRDFVGQLTAADRRAKVVVLGDLNDFDFSAPINTITSTGQLVDLPRTLPPAERYTYVFEGNSEVLDHILLSKALAYTVPTLNLLPLFDYDVVHVNSEFNDQISDHEPQVVRLLVIP